MIEFGWRWKFIRRIQYTKVGCTWVTLVTPNHVWILLMEGVVVLSRVMVVAVEDNKYVYNKWIKKELQGYK